MPNKNASNDEYLTAEEEYNRRVDMINDLYAKEVINDKKRLALIKEARKQMMQDTNREVDATLKKVESK